MHVFLEYEKLRRRCLVRGLTSHLGEPAVKYLRRDGRVLQQVTWSCNSI